jgi:hypothetical protein
MPSTTFSVGNAGQVTLESLSALPLLALAWGQKPQLAEHFSFRHMSRYTVVGLASSLPFSKPITMAEPVETRTLSGKHVSVILGAPTFFGIYTVNISVPIFISPKTGF